jgi:hypothetical protein
LYKSLVTQFFILSQYRYATDRNRSQQIATDQGIQQRTINQYYSNTLIIKVLRYYWVILAAVLFILPACGDVVQLQEEENLNELSFSKKVADIASSHENPQDLFQSIVEDVEKSTRDKASFSKSIREFDSLVKGINFTSTSQFRDNHNVNLTVDLLAKNNPLGEETFYKILALGSILIESNPEIVDMDQDELRSWIRLNLITTNKSAFSETNSTTEECLNDCAEDFAVDAAQASVVFSAGLIVCGLFPPVSPACLAGVMGYFAIDYAFELTRYFICRSRCTDDTIGEG